MPFPTEGHHLYVFPYTHFICMVNGRCCFVCVYLNVHEWCCYRFFSFFFLTYSALCVFKVHSCYFVQTSSLLLTVAKHSIVLSWKFPWTLSCLHVCMLSRHQLCLFAALWAVAHQAPLFRRFWRQECRSGLPCPDPGDLPDPEIEPASPVSPALQVDSLPLSQEGSLYCL